MSLEVVSEVATEVVSQTEAKAHCRVTNTASDSKFDALIPAARRLAEAYTGRGLIEKTLKLRLPYFPAKSIISLPMPPLQSVTSITYVDAQGGTQTFPTASYEVDTHSLCGRIVLKSDAAWPPTSDVMDAVTITFVAGYKADAAPEIPEDLKLAMLELIEHMYSFRGPVIVNSSVNSSVNTVPHTCETIFGTYQVNY